MATLLDLEDIEKKLQTIIIEVSGTPKQDNGYRQITDNNLTKLKEIRTFLKKSVQEIIREEG